MEIVTTAFYLLVVLGVIIFVHEAGHLLMARALDIRVLAFSLGFGPRLWGFKRGETDYKVSAFPLGGYVKLGGEHAEERTDDPRDFVNRPRWQRILVYLAGPLMNVVLALVLIAAAFMVGINLPPRKLPPVVGLVLPESPAAHAGLAMGDRIVAVDGQAISEFRQVQMAILGAPDKPLTLTYERAGQRADALVTPQRVLPDGYGDAGIAGPGKVIIAGVLKGGAAAAAGLQKGDHVLAVDGRTINTSNELIAYIQKMPGKEIRFGIERSRQTIEVPVTPQGPADQGRIGVSLDYGIFQRYSFTEAIVESFHYNVDLVNQTYQVLGKVLTRQLEAKTALAGPIGMARMIGEQANRGLNYLIHLMGFISISIALLNLLPIPVLDGGQITILLVESLMRRDLSMTLKERLTNVGAVLLLAIMAVVIFFDFQKLF